MSTEYDPTWVKEFYDVYGMKEWNRWEFNRVSWAIHVHYLRKAVKSDDRVLEMGAGAGRFTQVLAEITSNIVVADISPVQLEINEQQAKTLGFDRAVERRVECDVCDLTGQFNDGEFDTTVCYGGALSYVYDNAGRALSELMRVTRPGGYILVEVMSLWGSIHHDFSGVLSIPWEVNESIIRTGNLTKDMAVSQHYIHMYRAGEFRKLLEHAGLNIETMSTSHALSSGSGDLRHSVPEDSDMWHQLIVMELEACQEEGCLDLGTHLIAVCRNP
ncbi:MAG: class I SAM-dependent methyltransferase [Armatimonadota bacterium]